MFGSWTKASRLQALITLERIATKLDDLVMEVRRVANSAESQAWRDPTEADVVSEARRHKGETETWAQFWARVEASR